MESDPAAVMCGHDVDAFDSATNRTIAIMRRDPARWSTRMTSADAMRSVARHGVPYALQSHLVRRSALPSVGFREELRTVSDWLLLLETAARGDALYIDEVLARYRRHARNVTNTLVAHAEAIEATRIARRLFPALAQDLSGHLAELHLQSGIERVDREEYGAARSALARAFLHGIRARGWGRANFIQAAKFFALACLPARTALARRVAARSHALAEFRRWRSRSGP
jgi:hypothetical protein